TLPGPADVALGAETSAGKLFLAAMVRLWTAACTWEVPKADDATRNGHVGASRASLISRVKSQRRERERPGAHPGERERWHQIHPALAAWWRTAPDGEGELRVFLAMRWPLVGQVKQELPGVTDAWSLHKLGVQFGVLEAKPPKGIPTRLSGGNERLVVLAREITETLLAEPCEVFDQEGGDTVTGEECH